MAVWRAALAALAIIGIQSASAQISFDELLAGPRPVADERVKYGQMPDQFAELYMPRDAAPHAVVVLIHGGCWEKQLPGLELMAYLAGDLRARGYAVWNIEYRRLGEDGRGYPGTFKDVANAMGMLQVIAPQRGLDMHHLVVIGHSAGGHLALWVAARGRLPETSPLFSSPMPVSAVITLSGIDDLRAFHDRGPGACGEPGTIDRLIARPNLRNLDPYADTSPAALLPLGVKQFVVSGSLDDIVPAQFGRDYAALARAKGDTVQYVEVRDAGHFDMIDPKSNAWAQVLSLLQSVH